MLLHSLTNFEIKKSFQNEPKFNNVYSINKKFYKKLKNS